MDGHFALVDKSQKQLQSDGRAVDLHGGALKYAVRDVVRVRSEEHRVERLRPRGKMRLVGVEFLRSLAFLLDGCKNDIGIAGVVVHLTQLFQT